MNRRSCRSCGLPLSISFADLGLQPIANAFRSREQLSSSEIFYPLRAFVCSGCKLVQLEDFSSREDHFHENYVYFSSYSHTWLEHARRYAAEMIDRFGLNEQSRVVEIASNDGYLLRYFLEQQISALGIEPSANVAEAARRQCIETRVAFFGAQTARQLSAEGIAADLMPANNVLAHVPDLNDFVAGFRILLKASGVATFEFPHLLPLIRNLYFDTIYHEHYSYFSLLALLPLLERNGLTAFDVEELSTHGGSLRVYVAPVEANRSINPSISALIAEEMAAGLDRLEIYQSFAAKTRAIKRSILNMLCRLKDEGHSIAAYGAPAKGNTLLNYTGIRTDFIDFTVDRNPVKQGLFLPGTSIPVRDVSALEEKKPDYVIILPWNLAGEIMEDQAHIRSWGGRFIILLPAPRIL
jgi:C-methyltransferase C-terminal domain/Putative zinc binding domain/Methyltransferase domain